MKFPFVPRGLYDETVADLRAQLRDERDRTRRLTRVVVKMKVAGGSIPRPSVRLEPRQPDEMAQAITQALDANPRTERDMKLRARHRSWAEREIAKDPSDAHVRSVLTKLRSWGTVTVSDDDDDVIAVSV